ncbi:transporter substrate-binding domain-containing protein [Psychrosphaera sp. B3R10]|uniref:substrate-binding periplasmic protein n=1 Tax=unclassified Psychrosphaera TaxID=2641570 RepID=UPI001C09BB2F|nr:MULTISPECIES: transporter substrate-binding domain-containing protein [unclassified Psychrosphaera]MBU2883123.1 transporter substrate-binding domain-containing protein [Psychrosphaera sp. I2R16]MBU2988579.1 transporter substrate-binding domain-containing protein [Psychrosphaera sp. B3R10]
MLKLILIILTNTLVFNAFAFEHKKPFDLFTYIDKPPFILDQEKEIGMSYDLARSLEAFAPTYHFQVVYVPKIRALKMLNEKSGALLWTNPLWVNDRKKSKYDWISNLMLDSELYITNDKDLVYKDISSLNGKVIVGVRGYVYVNFEDGASQHNFTRFNVRHESLVADMLLKNRADVGIIGLQSYWFMKRNNPDISKKTYILNGDGTPFYRSILTSKASPELNNIMVRWLRSDLGKKQWQAIKNKWLH